MFVRLSRESESILLESAVAVALYPLLRWSISSSDALKVVPYSISASLMLLEPVVSESTLVIPAIEGLVTV